MTYRDPDGNEIGQQPQLLRDTVETVAKPAIEANLANARPVPHTGGVSAAADALEKFAG